uniref:Uncharacterized protein n=1 Tax=viral metagenome TaxID=1070528 RepID=A0A6H1ZKV1_9ZZZZ
MGGLGIEGRDLTYVRPTSTPSGDYLAYIPPKDWVSNPECGYTIPQTIAATTYQDLCVDGDWYNVQKAASVYGTINMTITQGNIGAKGYSPYNEPAYVSAFLEGIEWKIRVNKQVIVPTIIRDLLRDSGYVA